MKGMKLALLVVLLAAACVLLSGCATTTETTPEAFTAADNGTTVSIGLGEMFSVSLAENPTTGFLWDITTTDGIAIESDKYTPDQPPEGDELMTGAGGVHEWVFKTTDSGTQKVMGIYKRPWENTTGAEDTFELTLNVAQ
ncbi:MAG: protease inhibitor I42 family protein [Methermicoccaceae archaeon]